MTDKEIMQQALEALEGADAVDTDMQAAITALKNALEQQQAEPVAQSDLIKRLRDTASKGVSVWGDLQMEAAREIEILTAERECYASAMDRVLAAQPQRQWVGLTDEDWEKGYDIKGTSLDTFAHGVAWAADQLKEKNDH